MRNSFVYLEISDTYLKRIELYEQLKALDKVIIYKC